jgi:hypothetical protein
MASPFPGMDPYLEDPAHWPDFHATFINYCRETLSGLLPAHYTARIGERVYLVEGPPLTKQMISPDVALERQPSPAAPSAPVPATATAAVRAPVTLPLVVLEEPRETYVEVLHRPDRSLVAVLELLSPANKEEPGRGTYLAKRNGLLRQNVHLVELDLLLGGRRLPLRVPLPPADYYAFVARGDRRPDCDVYHWMLPEPLPLLPIPLRTPDPDVFLDVGSVFATAYERGGYAREIDYALPPPVPLATERQQWVVECLRAARA